MKELARLLIDAMVMYVQNVKADSSTWILPIKVCAAVWAVTLGKNKKKVPL